VLQSCTSLSRSEEIVAKSNDRSNWSNISQTEYVMLGREYHEHHEHKSRGLITYHPRNPEVVGNQKSTEPGTLRKKILNLSQCCSDKMFNIDQEQHGMQRRKERPR